MISVKSIHSRSSRLSRMKTPYLARYLVDNCHVFQSGLYEGKSVNIGAKYLLNQVHVISKLEAKMF